MSYTHEELGGVCAIAAVVDHFSDAVVQNPIVGKTSQNPALRESGGFFPRMKTSLAGRVVAKIDC